MPQKMQAETVCGSMIRIDQLIGILVGAIAEINIPYE